MRIVERLEAQIRELAGEVGRLKDQDAIRNLRFAYHTLVNEDQLDRLHTLWVEDGSMRFSDLWSAADRTEIRQHYTAMKEAALAPFVKQFTHNHVITLEGDRASGFSYFEAKPVKGGESYLVCGRFDDTYVRQGGKWLFKDVALTLYFMVPLREGWARAVASGPSPRG